ERFGRPQCQGRACPDHLDALTVLEPLSHDSLCGLAVHDGDEVRDYRPDHAVQPGHQIFVLEIDLESGAAARRLNDRLAQRETALGLPLDVDDLAVEQYAGLAELAGRLQCREQRCEGIPAGLPAQTNAAADG